MAKFPEKLSKRLEKRVQENALRTLSNYDDLVDFSSNDYLGFARNPSIKKMVDERLHEMQLNGATGSRLLSGNHEFYEKLEAVLCKYHRAEAALVFNSGYDSNLGFFSSVPQRNDVIFYDELCHASIRDGIQLSNAKSIKFKHNDIKHLNTKLTSFKANWRNLNTNIYVATESVFSMDGDSPNLKELAKFCTKNKLFLVVDEAHAIGVFERGLVNQLGLEKAIFARIITFGKALGVHGAAILGSSQLRDYLINFSRSLIYTTALPPHTVNTILAAYQVSDSDYGQDQVKRLKSNINCFKSIVQDLGMDSHISKNDSAIQICTLEGNEKTRAISKSLMEKGFDVRPILSPTVQKGQERLRICLHAFNTEKEIKSVLNLINVALQDEE